MPTLTFGDAVSAYPPPTFDTTRPHPARVRNYFLGGKDNFPVDREHGDNLIAVFPEIFATVRASREFLVRAVSHLAGEAGLRQFLDIGPGLPAEGNTHSVAQRIAPESRVVYVDIDPLVLAHARALLVSSPEGATAYIDADLHDPEKILGHAAQTLDFSKPVGLVLTSVLGLIPELDEATSIVRTLLAALPSGSHLIVDDGTADPDSEQILEMKELSGGYEYRFRTKETIGRFFDGLELLEPGIVSPSHWRNDPGSTEPVARFQSCGVGCKP